MSVVVVITGSDGSTITIPADRVTINPDGTWTADLGGQTFDQEVDYTAVATATDGGGLTGTSQDADVYFPPTIVVDPGNPGGANDVVYEAGLGDGSGVGETTTTVEGTFTLSDADGLDDIASVTINGQAIAIGDLIGSTISGTAGTFTVTGYNSSTGWRRTATR